MTLIDKFNIIQEFTCQNSDYTSLINNYIENYLESEINIIHPELIYQLVWNNLIIDIDDILNNKLKNYILNLKKTIKSLIKNEKFNLDNGLNSLINNYYYKTSYLKIIFKTSNYKSENLFHDIILSDQIVICYLQNELNTINKSNKNTIKKLLKNIKKITNEHNYNWFLKLIGTSLRDNIPHISLIIDNYNFIDFIMLINYTQDIYYYYNFISENDSKIIINSFVDIIFDKLLLLLSTTNYNNITKLLTTKWDIITKINNDNQMIIPIKKELSMQISKSIKKINTISNIQYYDLLKLIISAAKIGLIETYIFSIFTDKYFLEKVIEIIDTNINNDVQFICDIIVYLKIIKDSEIFINNYHNKLIKRLLSLSTNLNNELLVVNQIYIHFDNKYPKKLLNCIYDIQTSLELNLHYTYNINYTNISIITISYSNWNINWNNGFIDDNIINDNVTNNDNSIYKLFELYNINYINSYENKRKLLWLPQYGEIIIEYNNNEITLFPIQLMVLELFNQKNNINIDDIKNSTFFKNYSDNYKMNIIKSLILAGILNNNSNILSLSDTIIKNNFIDVYYYILNTNEKSNHEIINDELCLSRKNIVSCIINHHIKINSFYYETLYNLVKSDIKLFSLNKEVFDETIEWMINNDYIIEKESKYFKLLF